MIRGFLSLSGFLVVTNGFTYIKQDIKGQDPRFYVLFCFFTSLHVVFYKLTSVVRFFRCLSKYEFGSEDPRQVLKFSTVNRTTKNYLV